MELRRSVRWLIAFTCTATLLGCGRPYTPAQVIVPTAQPRTQQPIQQPVQNPSQQPSQTQFGEILSPTNQVVSGSLADVNGLMQGMGLDEDAPIGASAEGADFALTQPKSISNQLILELKPGSALQSSIRGFTTASGGQMVQTISVGKQYAVSSFLRA